MPFKSLETSSALRTGVRVTTPWCHKLPHLNRLVQTTGHQIPAVRRKSDGVDTVLVAIRTLQSLHQVARGDIPHSHTLVQRTGSDVAGIRRDGNGGDAVFDAERHDVRAGLNVPQADGAVARSRSDGAAILGEVEGVDILLVTREGVSDLVGGDVPHSDQFILCTGGKVLPIRAEADATDVQVTHGFDGVILEHADFLSSVDVEDLSGSVATGGDILSVVAEADTADYALVLQGVEEVHVENAWHAGVEDGEPVVGDLLLVRWQALKV